MNKGRKNFKQKVLLRHRIVAAMLSALLLAEVLPPGTALNVFAANEESVSDGDNTTEGSDYRVNTPNGTDGWYKAGGVFEIAPMGRFDQIGESEEGEWKSILAKSEETEASGAEVTFYLRNSVTGEISKKHTVCYKLDKTPPLNASAEPKWGYLGWERRYLGKGSKWDTDNYEYYVTLTATDAVSGVSHFFWRYKNDSAWSERVTATAGKAEIGVNYNRWNSCGGIEVIACDVAGNLNTEVIVPAQNALTVEYDTANLQRYVNAGREDVSAEKLDGSTQLIYNGAVRVTLTATAATFDDTGIALSINDEPAAIAWTASGDSYVGTITLSEGSSVVKISAPGYSILSNEIGGRIVNAQYCSNTHIVDVTNPVMEVTFAPETAVDNRFNSDREMTVSITDKNFRPNELYFQNLTATDILGNSVDSFDADGFLRALKKAVWKTEGDVHSATVIFSSDANYSFTLGYSDMANNSAAAYTATPFSVDKTGPDNLRIAYVSNPVSTFLQMVTFGYYKESVTVRLYADDTVSGVDHFNWTYTQEDGSSITYNVATKSAQIDCTDSEHFLYVNDKTAVAEFTLTAEEFAQYRGSFCFTATDKSGFTGEIHYGDGTAEDENGNVYNTAPAHVVVVDTIAPTREVIYPEPQQIREKGTLAVFTGDKEARANEENTNSILYYDDTYGDVIPVTLKITEANFYAEDVLVEVNGSAYVIEDWSQNEDEWTGTVKLTNDGTYVIKVSYTDRSGNTMPVYQSEYITIDRVQPEIEKYEFTPTTSDGDTDASSFVEVLEYGYYFKTDFVVNIYASDTFPSSGLDTIEYRLVPYENGVKQTEISGFLQTANGVASLSVPAGFKGQIFAKSSDYTGNRSAEVTPQAFVVDKTAPTIEVKCDNATTYRDASGNLLYVTDTNMIVTITDTVSGIKEIGYAQSSENAGFDRKNIVLANTGYSVGDSLGDGWTVLEMDANLVTGVAKTFTYSKDDNDIVLTFDATDRSGNKRENVAGETFTIDKTEPVINIAFRMDDDTDMYYDADRIADIKVIERNFDAALIQAMIENKLGNIPDVTFTKISNTEYTAVIVFDEGDYRFEVGGTDLGGHAARVSYSGGNENFFCVDKTQPIVTDNFAELKDSGAENSFYNDKTISIAITEHNFDPALVNLHILRKDAGLSHGLSGFADITSKMLSDTGWVTNGDVHTITFTLSEDAVYRVEILPQDLAGNMADYRSSAVFEIDKTVPVVSAKNNRHVKSDDAASLEVYTYERKDEPAPVIEFSDLNIDHLEYSLTVWIPDYTDSEALPVIRPTRVFLEEDSTQSGIINGGKFVLPDFTEDGVYALELVAVDVAGNKSEPNVNTYVRMIDQDVLAFILNSNVENKTGVYSFQYENGVPMSKRPDNFSDLKIMVLAKKDTNVDIVLRNANAEEIYANAQATVDDSIYGLTVYNFVLKADFFKDNFSGDTDADLNLTVKNEDKRIDLGRIHIDNVAPIYDLPKEFTSWHWYFGEEARTVTVSNIDELLDENNCKVYDNGKQVDFVYSSADNSIVFTLERGWHNVGIVLRDMAGNENNIPEKIHMYVGYFWLWVILTGTAAFLGTILFFFTRERKRREMLENS